MKKEETLEKERKEKKLPRMWERMSLGRSYFCSVSRRGLFLHSLLSLAALALPGGCERASERM